MSHQQPVRDRVSRAKSKTMHRAVTAILCWVSATAATAEPVFKVYVEHPGVYRVSYEDLAAAGLQAETLPSAELGMTRAGESVPIWVADGGDGLFQAGDWIELVGEHLRGEVSYFNEHSRYNVYVLSTQSESPLRMRSSKTEAQPGVRSSYRAEQHLEEDLLLLRLPAGKNPVTEELWYWKKLIMTAKEPFLQTLDLSDLDARPEADVAEMRIEFRGWSNPRHKASPEVRDHRIELALNGKALATAEWDGTQPFLMEVPGIPAQDLAQGANSLGIRVPKREAGPDGSDLVDVIVLNWIEVSYPRGQRIDGAQTHLHLDSSSGPARLMAEAGRRLVAYGSGGSRVGAAVASEASTEEGAQQVFQPPAGETSFIVTDEGGLMAPAAVFLDQPSDLKNPENQADYVMIAHRSLLESIEPLAEFHRSRGLKVEVVDLQDVYDEHNHGVSHPRAIRTFLRHAYESWQRPTLKYVLLVGDASWDSRNVQVDDENYADWTFRQWERERFAKNESHPYDEDADQNHRGLLPTWNHPTHQGHSASDNYFADLEGNSLPEIALGRLPVVKPEEVTAIVQKIVRYVKTPEVGPWRRNLLMITNESRGFQARSDRLAGDIAADGLTAQKVYPQSSETSNEHHSERLVQAFDEGQVLVHFLGHGGRYIWRTGPPDLNKNHDLFTLEHLDQLAPNGRLPLVLSLTCYSAPFDHPNADSIGEKLLRVEGRGAIAVLGASWRNSPSPRWGRILLEELLKPEATIGEAIRLAKRRIASPLLVETYNLLGDPAVPLALPAGHIALHVAHGDAGALQIGGTVDMEAFAGELIVEAVNGTGDVLAVSTLSMESPSFELALDLGTAELEALNSVRAYAWNVERGVDAMGSMGMKPPKPSNLP